MTPRMIHVPGATQDYKATSSSNGDRGHATIGSEESATVQGEEGRGKRDQTQGDINQKKMADMRDNDTDNSTDTITLNTLASMMLELMRQQRAEVASSEVRNQTTQRQLSGIR